MQRAEDAQMHSLIPSCPWRIAVLLLYCGHGIGCTFPAAGILTLVSYGNISGNRPVPIWAFLEHSFPAVLVIMYFMKG